MTREQRTAMAHIISDMIKADNIIEENEIEEKINEVRAKILQGMETHGADKIHSEQFSVSYTPARTVLQFDSKTFRIENEKLYLSYCRPKER